MHLPESFRGGELTLLQGGLTNRSYRLILPRGDYFLRISTPFAARLGIQRRRELVLHQLAAELGLAPRLHFIDPEQGLLIRDWIDAEALGAVDWHTAPAIAQLAQLMRQIHQLPVPVQTQPLVLEAHLRFYMARICNRDPRISQLFHLMLARLQCLPSIAQVFCHNDLSPANLLGNPLQLVDWEYAGLGDPAFELACAIRAFNFDEPQARQLQAAYQALGGECPWERVEPMLSVADFVAVLWANVFWVSCNEAQFRTMFEQRLAELCRREGLQ